MTKSEDISIVWFRRDLRLEDNPALSEASKQGSILPIFIFNDEIQCDFIGQASAIWLHHSLKNLNDSLNGKLNIYIGNPTQIINDLILKHEVKNVFWNISYEPTLIKEAQKVWQICEKRNVKCNSFNGNYLWHPKDILKDDKSYYKVFTAYRNKVLSLQNEFALCENDQLKIIKDSVLNIDNLELLVDHSWVKSLLNFCESGESNALRKFDLFIENRLKFYQKGRDYPSHAKTSMLSAHLHFGEISPRRIYNNIMNIGQVYAPESDVKHFVNEVVWREFSNYLLYHFKGLPNQNFNNKFDNFEWEFNKKHFESWKRGLTGYPIIDAGMRQLWQTGYMHNRVRMVVASFLVKNLNIDWRHGRDWFWECLFDADLANNSASWQWIAGCGADAALYFRIFNPTLQAEKFDPDGEYIRHFVPELKDIPNKD